MKPEPEMKKEEVKLDQPKPDAPNQDNTPEGNQLGVDAEGGAGCGGGRSTGRCAGFRHAKAAGRTLGALGRGLLLHRLDAINAHERSRVLRDAAGPDPLRSAQASYFACSLKLKN